MSAHRAVLLALLVVGGSLATAAPTGATLGGSDDATDAVAAAAAGPAAAQSADANETENASLGADISSFMQSSAAEIGGAVETGMWTESFNATENQSERRRLVERRTTDLRAELDDVRERKAELEAERESGNLSTAAYKAQVGQLVGRINALEAAINATEPRARQVNANVDAVEMLETDARNLTGPRVAAVARNTSGVGTPGPPEGVGDGDLPGTAGDAGPSEEAANGTPAGDGDGPGANATDEAGLETNAGGDAPGERAGDAPDTPGAGGGEETELPTGTGPPGDAGAPANLTDDPGTVPETAA